MDTSRWNQEKRGKIHDWLDRGRVWIGEGLELGFTLKEISLEVRAEALRQAVERWGPKRAAKELGISRQAFWQALERLEVTWVDRGRAA